MKFKEECMDLFVSIVIVGVIISLMSAFCLFGKDNKVIEAITAIGTFISAGGLLWFGQLTYKNQQNNEFYSLFSTLLNEHNRLLKDLLEEHKEKVEEINKKALFKMLSSHSDEKEWKPELASEKLRKAISDIPDNKTPFIEEQKEKEMVKKVITDIKRIIEHKVEIKPYLIILFRLLKLVDGTEKIDKEDKREYYALVRGLIPMEILLLILFNSRVWPEKANKSSDRKYKNYKELLEAAKLFEHLPIKEALKKAVGLSEQPDKAVGLSEQPDKAVGLSEQPDKAVGLSEQPDNEKNDDWDKLKEELNKRWGVGNNDGKAENKEIDSILKQFVWVVYCGGFIGKNAFGQSVYIKKMKDKENIGNT